ncbi:chlorophyllide a oxygenase, chloroplastic-like [Mangifera indica]|uniref:chlorophyllide a oxygenase, chloroplastic-like n=1 Tax=Mangifera indica TaxID=29780 RepID=UPI001CFB4786|nr:chlorophyllide a oxygenase, chloroplastic-like [Mangifera indica]
MDRPKLLPTDILTCILPSLFQIPIECFEEPWVIFRGKDGKPDASRMHLHIESIATDTDGKCEKMPSTRLLNVKIKSVPCFEKEGMTWIWPGDEAPTANLLSLLPPSGFEIHAEIPMELPTEHGLLLDNLLYLAHAPFTHSSTLPTDGVFPAW